MTTAQVVETSVTVTNSSFQNYTHPDDHTTRTVVALFAVSFISFGVWLFLAMYSPHSLKKLCSYHFVSLSGLCPQCCKLFHILYVQRPLSSGFETIILQRHHLLSVMSRKSSFTSTIPGEQPACAADVEGVNHAS